MEFQDYIKTEPIELLNFNDYFNVQDLDSIKRYYQIIEEKIKNNEYYVQDHQ